MARDILTSTTETEVAQALQPWFTGSQQEAIVAAVDKGAKAAYDEGFTNTQTSVNEVYNDLASTADGMGADLVGFIQSGTGAVARTIQDKARETLTPQDFGAAGDGTTDDSAAFAKLVTAAIASGRAVEVPPGEYLVNPLNINPTFTAAGQSFVMFGHGAASVLKIADGAQVLDWQHVIRVSPSYDTERIEIRDLMVDANARGSAAPAGENDYQHAASILITGAAGITIKDVVVDNIFAKDPVADSVWLAHNATTVVESVRISNINEIDRTRTRHTVTVTRLPKYLLIENIPSGEVHCEPTAPTVPVVAVLNNCHIEWLAWDMVSESATYPARLFANNLHVTEYFAVAGCIATVSNGVGKVVSDGRSTSDLLEGSQFNNFTFLLPYNADTNSVTPFYPHYSSETVRGGITFNDCDFVIDSTDPNITPTGHGIWSQSICSSATTYKRTYVFNNCKLDPRLEYGIHFYRNGYWKMNNMTWAGRVAAMQVTTASSRVVDAVINGGDFSAVSGAVIRGGFFAMNQTTDIAKIAMSGHWHGVSSGLVQETSGAVANANWFGNNSRIITLDALPTAAIVGDTIRLRTTTLGAGKDYLCTASSSTAPTFRMVRQAGVGKGTTANRPTPGTNDVGLRYLDTTLHPDGWPIVWNGVKWVDEMLSASKTYDWPDLATATTQSTTVTVTGAALGDFAEASMSVSLGGTRLWAEVTAADTVTVYQRNDTGANVNVASGTLRVKVRKQ